MPSTPITVNQAIITGLNTLAMPAVPRCCTANRPIRMTTEIGITQSATAGVATSKPSTADSTDTAGVIRPSPYRRAVPNTPSVTTPAATFDTVWPSGGITNDVRARMPPSPWLSARMTCHRYLSEMTMISAQNAIDAAPYVVVFVISSSAWWNDSLKA